MAWRWGSKDDGVLAQMNETGDVDGEADPLVRVRRIVTGAREVWNIGHVHAFNLDLELSDTIVEVVEVEALEAEKHRFSRWRVDG